MVFHIFAIVTLVAAIFLIYYLRHVPDGSACPRCGSLLHRTAGAPVSMSVLSRWTDRAGCVRCDWSGRVRRGPEVKRAAVRAESGRPT